MQVPVHNKAGEVVGQTELPPAIFEVIPHQQVVYQAMLRQLANARLGTADTETRGEVTGGGRKPWRQKGTGRARQGSIRSPLWPGGGIVFGPHPRSYAQDLPKKMRRLALKSCLAARAAEGHLRVVDALPFERPRTKDMIQVLQALGLEAPLLIVTAEAEPNLVKSARNIPGVKTLPAPQLNVLDLLNYDYLLLTQGAIKRIEEIWGDHLAVSKEA